MSEFMMPWPVTRLHCPLPECSWTCDEPPPNPDVPPVPGFGAPDGLGAGLVLTSGAPQPPPGTRVLDCYGVTWEHDEDGGYWLREDLEGGGDPESWTKVAGNYGPVTVLEWGESDA